jgi:hypothetical protein
MFEEAVRYSKAYEMWIYAGLGVVALYALVKFFLSWEELRRAAFGMERDIAQGRLNQAALLLLLLLTMTMAEFSIVTFIAPTMPGTNPLPSPTLNLLATATATLLPPPGESAPGDATQLSETAQPTLAQAGGEGCTPGQVEITAPKNGDTVSGVVEVIGTADIPNFGFYKYEIARPNETVWLSINAGEQAVKEALLGEWVTSVLPPGDYQLRLVVADNQGKFQIPCVIQVRVAAEPEQDG